MDKGISYSIALGVALVAALISAIGGAVYVAWGMTFPAMILTLALSAALGLFLLRKFRTPRDPNAPETAPLPPKSGWWRLGLIPLYTLAGVCITLLTRAQTDLTLVTPWSAVPKLFWIALALAAVSGVAVLLRARGALTQVLAALPILAIGVSVAALVYRIGYGFDPFIHQAAEKYILLNGVITPKTLYYAGQYALVTIIARFSGASVHVLDVALLPALATLGILGALGYASRALKFGNGVLVAAALAFIPLSPFIATTPFGLATLYALLAALIALARQARPRAAGAMMWICTAAAVLTHPLAGIPALVLAVLTHLEGRGTVRWIARSVVIVGGAVALPALFILLARVSGNGSGVNFDALKHPLEALAQVPLPFAFPLTRFHALGDTVYALGILATIAIFGGMVAALWNRAIPARSFLLASIGSAASGALLALTVSFSYLPDYEQGGYAARLLLLAVLLAVPPACVTIASLLEKVSAHPLRAMTAIGLISIFFTGGVYLAYPRSDAYVLGHGYSTSRTDIETVRAIADDAKEPYIVLASQPVSAAALNEFGFFSYFNTPEGPAYAYPVPTGGPLYPFYLEMVYDEPSTEYMKQAMELTGVKRGYLVVNTYWTRSDHIISRAKATSDSWFAINEADYVFKFSR